MKQPILANFTFTNAGSIESARVYDGTRWSETVYDPPIPISADDELSLRFDGERVLVEISKTISK